MKKLLSIAGLMSLLLAVGCGSNSSSTTSGGPTPTGNFSNSSLSGQYAYQITGSDLSNPSASFLYNRAGVFTANGAGTITSGSDDFTEQTLTPLGPSPFTGTYSISSDGTGTLTFTFSSGTLTLAITMVNSSTVYLVEADTNLVGGGTARQQATSAFATVPSGTFAFRMHTIDANAGSIGCVGLLTVTGGVITGTEDISSFNSTSGQFTTATHSITTGLLNTPDPTIGRGTGNYTDDTGFTTTFDYYVVDTSNLIFLSTTPIEIATGVAQKQSGTFSNASLSGNYVFGLRGDSINTFQGVQTAGRFTANNGSLSAGAFDGVRDGVQSTNISFTGTYTVASNGRAVLTLNPSTGGSAQHIYYMISPSQAFVLINDANAVAEGTVDVQSGTFSNSTVTGQFAFLADGIDFSPETVDRVATLTLDGAGHLTLDEFVNISGSGNAPGALTGTYSVASNGRMTGSVSSLSDNLIFYLASGSNGFMVQNDNGVEIGGMISKQP
jgi:hypothetical protein